MEIERSKDGQLTLWDAVQMSGFYRIPVRVKSAMTGRIFVQGITKFDRKNEWLKSLPVQEIHPIVTWGKGESYFHIFYEAWCYESDFRTLKEQHQRELTEEGQEHG